MRLEVTKKDILSFNKFIDHDVYQSGKGQEYTLQFEFWSASASATAEMLL